ncbi:MAG TPA: hypothetical protein VE081_03285 [Sporichthyaceae bacterium]|nr:hypothetical protein [Sporichthyaceae bacterium]
MPRYRFRWESIPSEMLDELAAELELAGEDTLVALRRRYGARPTTQFVRDLWGTLRDGWLTRDDDARAWVATELRTYGLGDPSLADDVRYLQSCRNAETLRRTVLIAFHDLGEEDAPGPGRPAVPETAEQAGMARRPSSMFDLDVAIDSAWTGFADRLVGAVGELGAHDSVIIGLPTALNTAELEGAAPYVQILGMGEDYVRGEVSGDAYLDARLRLSEARTNALLAVGWAPPDSTPGDEFSVGSANFTADLPRSAATRLVEMTVATVRDVFGVPHPSFLELPGLAAATTSRAEDLRSRVERTLAEHFGEPVLRDKDGDIPIRAGSAMIFIRVATNSPVVELFSPLLLDAPGDALALERINRANRSIRFAKLTWTGGRVMVNHEIWCEPFVPELLIGAVGVMMSLADELDDRLRAEVGGRRFFEDVDNTPAPTGGTDPDGLHPALATIVQLTTDNGVLSAAQAARICKHDTELVLELIIECSRQAIEWRSAALEAASDEESVVCRAEADSWDGTATLLRAALREIALG